MEEEDVRCVMLGIIARAQMSKHSAWHTPPPRRNPHLSQTVCVMRAITRHSPRSVPHVSVTIIVQGMIHEMYTFVPNTHVTRTRFDEGTRAGEGGAWVVRNGRKLPESAFMVCTRRSESFAIAAIAPPSYNTHLKYGGSLYPDAPGP